MFWQKTHQTFRPLLLCALLITHTSISPLLTEKFNFAQYQYYIITCITSCCIGMLICILIQKHYSNGPTLVPKENSKDKGTKKQLLEQLLPKINNAQTDIHTIKEEQKKLINLAQEQKNNICLEPLQLFRMHNNCLIITSLLHWRR